MSQATRLYKAAETLGKADTSTLGAAVYTLPSKIERDGFTASAVIFSGSSVGILLDDEVAQKAAQHFGLRSEGSHLFGASSLGFARVLPDEQQSMKELGLISVVARQGPALAGKTLLACEFVSHADREALEQYDARQR
ncbi:hypothetical protein VHN57_05860 [Sphingobium sp. WW5]|uniref:hypothetical protein n=1 Tax=unclassified Sphingobium TaxID=2611147 RepID=UPI003C2374CC